MASPKLASAPTLLSTPYVSSLHLNLPEPTTAHLASHHIAQNTSSNTNIAQLFTTCIEDTCPFDGNRSVFPTEMACEGHEATLEADKELTANGAVASYPVALSMFAKGRMAAVPPGGWNLCHRFMGCPNAPRAVPEASELVARGFPGGWNLCHRFMGCPPKARRATADAVNSVSHIYPGAWGPCGFFHVCENAVSHDDGNYSGNDKRSPAVPPSFGFCGKHSHAHPSRHHC